MQPEAIFAFIVAYLIGSVDFGVVLPRLRGVDIYAVGSGNPGASNVIRTMGRKWGVAVLVGDMVKGFTAAMIAGLWAGDAAGYAAMFAAVAGHCYPVWHRFRGGKGVATAGGALLWLEPLLGIAAMVGWGVLLAITKVASIASLTMMVAVAPAAAAFGARGWSLVWAAATGLLIVYRHRGNVVRLIRGEERTVQA